MTPTEADEDGALNLPERVAASMGAWLGTLFARCAPPSGPFFSSDGRQASPAADFRATPPTRH